MLESILTFLFPSTIESIYHEGYLDGAYDTAKLVCDHSNTGRYIMDDIAEGL